MGKLHLINDKEDYMEREKKLYYGAAYYPELWLDKVAEDIKLMKEVGINLVRVGEFAWAYLEPEEGKYEFEWLEEVLNKVYENGIKFILCTPTATPPIWVTYNYPETRYVDRDGIQHVHGSRQHVCVNSPKYIALTKKIVEEIAKRFGTHKGLIGWQIDNEFLCHRRGCYCDRCKEGFQKMLKEKYKEIEELNERWGTGIWSEKYQRFEQIPLPERTPFLHHCSLETEYKRYTSESYVRYAKLQAEIIRRYSEAPISHNTMPPHHIMNSEKLFNELDIPGCDGYNAYYNFELMIREYDWLKAFKDERQFWWLETSPSYNGCIYKSHQPLPEGFLKVESAIGYWMGAEVFSYWLWRGQRSGSEMVHGSVIYAWGKPTSGYKDVKEAGKYMREIEGIIKETKPVIPEVAIHFSYDPGLYMLETEPMLDGFKYQERWYEDIYKPILELGIYRDIIFPGKGVDRYKVVITPYMPAMDEGFLEKMERYVEGGGIWIVGPMSGYNTMDHTRHTDKCLGRLEDICGVEIIYSYPGDKEEIKGEYEGEVGEVKWWIFGAKGEGKTKYIGMYMNSRVKGLGMITERKVGKGKVIFIGGTLEKEIYKRLIKRYCEERGVRWIYKISKGSIVIPREGEGGEEYLLVANWDGKGGYLADRDYTIKPFSVEIIK